MADKNIDSKHEQKRNILRSLGFALITVGGILLLIALVEFFYAFNGGPMPRHFYLGFIGMPLLAAGGMCLMYGYFGAAARYVSGEAAPVATDTINYVARGIEEGVEDIAKSVSKGINSSSVKERIFILCPKCKTKNDEDAKFCKKCSEKLS